MHFQTFFFAFLVTLSTISRLQPVHAETVFPGKTWEQASPESQGLDAEKVEAAMAHLKSLVGPDGISQTLIIRHGRIIWQGEHTDSWHNVFSCTKSISSMTVGLLIEEGILELDTPLSEFVPALKAQYPELSARHCLSLTSGYQAEDRSYPFTPAPPLFKDGEKMRYGGEALNMMSHALSQASGTPLSETFETRIAKPIGLGRKWDWGDYGRVEGVKVNNTSGSDFKGVHTSAQNLARIGLLLLNDGSWEGKQLLSKAWIDQATTPQSPADIPLHDEKGWYKTIQGAYGLGFWVNGIRADGKRLWPDAPAQTYALQGNLNNICFVIPEWDMVFIRLGTDKVIPNEKYNQIFSLLKKAFIP
ncbi:serine hydrolase [Kiritimatiellaeota bacterium B1221]|nr:serine hydrolase [Kiritimatiellaeota bacterium B1221]